MQWCGRAPTARPSSARGCPAWGGSPLLARGIPPGYLPTPGRGVSVPAAVGKGVTATSNRASRPIYIPLAPVPPEGTQPLAAPAALAAVCLPGCRRAADGELVGPVRLCCAARVGFHALTAHAGVRADAFDLVLVSHPPHSRLFVCTQTRAGRAGLEPAGGLKPLRPMMGRGQPRPVQLSGFSEPSSFSVFFPGPAGLYAGHVLLYPAHARQAFLPSRNTFRHCPSPSRIPAGPSLPAAPLPAPSKRGSAPGRTA